MQTVKLRRLRKNKAIRDWASQTKLLPKNIIAPYFVVEGRNIKKEISSLPGIYHFSVDKLIGDIAKTKALSSLLIFGVPNKKDNNGSESYKKTGIVQKAVKALKNEFPNLIVITDVCLCAYTLHGHCGIVRPQIKKTKSQRAKSYESKVSSFKSDVCSLESDIVIDNDSTLEVLSKIAVSHAQAGADFVAPSAMMDGQVRAIREALNNNRFKDTGIIGYSAKYASNFYGPFREALGSSPIFKDRKTYQMDFRNSDQALCEIKQDIDEGADIVMVKPAISYLDIIYRAKEKFNMPVAAYSVSGEYSMIKKMAGGNSNYEKDLVLEVIGSIKRAGADFIITYWAKDLIKWIK